MEALNLYFEIQGLQIRCVQGFHNNSHISSYYTWVPLFPTPQHTPPSLGEYSIMTQPCNLEKLTKGLF